METTTAPCGMADYAVRFRTTKGIVRDTETGRPIASFKIARRKVTL